MTPSASDFSRSEPISAIPPEGAHVAVAADEGERARIAQAAGVVTLDRLTGAFDLSHLPGGGVKVEGLVEADVVQTCVVTLEPVENHIREQVSIRFLPPEQIEPTPDGEEAEPALDDDIEPLEADAIDLGRLTREFMLLALDPYPRKEGVAFEPPAAGESGAHPFAALAGLRARMKDRPPE